VVIVGGSAVVLMTVKFDVLVAVPSGVVMLSGPVEVPGAIVRVRVVTFTIDAAPLTVTVGAAARLLPVTVTTVPTGPLCGVKDVILGAVAYARDPRHQRVRASSTLRKRMRLTPS